MTAWLECCDHLSRATIAVPCCLKVMGQSCGGVRRTSVRLASTCNTHVLKYGSSSVMVIVYVDILHRNAAKAPIHNPRLRLCAGPH